MSPSAAAVALGLTAVTALQAPAPPQFPGGTRLIRLDVSVVDGKGRPITGLGPDDFVVKEEGRGVEVSYFQAVDDPRGRGASAAEGPAADLPLNRILLLVDARPMTTGQLMRARTAVGAYVRQAPDGEWLRLANLATGQVWDAHLPEGRSTLLAAARTLQTRTSAWSGPRPQDELPITEQVEIPAGPGRPSQSETSGQFLSVFAQGVGLLGTLEALLTELEGVPGRKALVLVSPGFPQMRGLDRRLQHVSTLARAAATAVYYVDVTAMDGLLPEQPGQALVPAFESAWLRSGGAQDLAEATGGFTSRFDNSLLPALTRVAAEMRSYYVVGYVPAAADGRFHRVDVKVKVPGASARTKKGYVAAR
jgi:VWFA-related protein